MRAVVIGAKGFVGAELARALLKRGHEVVAVDIGKEPGRLAAVADDLEWIAGDCASPETIFTAIGRRPVDAIYYGPFYRGRSLSAELNVMATGAWQVFELARAFDIKRILFPSSTAVHGHQRAGVALVSETEHLNTDTLYGATKLMCEQVGASVNRALGRNVITSVRLPSIYGPGADIGSRRVNVPAVQAARGEPARVDYPADARVCIAHVADSARFLADLCEADSVAQPVYELGGLEVSFADIAETVKTLVPGAEVQFGTETYTPLPHGIDWTLARQEFGLTHCDLSTGMTSIIDYERRAAKRASAA